MLPRALDIPGACPLKEAEKLRKWPARVGVSVNCPFRAVPLSLSVAMESQRSLPLNLEA